MLDYMVPWNARVILASNEPTHVAAVTQAAAMATKKKQTKTQMKKKKKSDGGTAPTAGADEVGTTGAFAYNP